MLIGAPAYAAPPVTETTTAKNVVDTFVDVGPGCDDGALYTVTTTTNLIEHTTVFDDGRIHATFTQSGTFVAVPLEDPSLPHRTPRRLGRLQRQRQSGERHLYLQHRRHRFGRLEVPPERRGAFQYHANGCDGGGRGCGRQLGVPSRWFVFLAPLCSANAMRSCAPLSERPVTGEVGYRSHAELIDDATARWYTSSTGWEAVGAIRSI